MGQKKKKVNLELLLNVFRISCFSQVAEMHHPHILLSCGIIRADFLAIRKSIEMYSWQESFKTVTHPDDQVKILNEVLLNVCSNFIPNRVKTMRPCQAAWITLKSKHKNFSQKKKSCV